MADDDSTLETSLKSLEISSNPLPTLKMPDDFFPLELNPFQKRRRSRSTGSIYKCLRRREQIEDKSKVNFKRKSNKLLKEPVLKYLTHDITNGSKTITKVNSCLKSTGDKIEKKLKDTSTPTDFTTLLDSCERLQIATEYQTEGFKTPHNNKSLSAKSSDSKNGTSNNATCSQEAIVGMRISPPCDVTMDELASYFETFVHIPKKMSSMAEMMYI